MSHRHEFLEDQTCSCGAVADKTNEALVMAAAAPIAMGAVEPMIEKVQTVEQVETVANNGPIAMGEVVEPQPVVEYVKPIETVVARKSRLPLVGALAALALAGGLGYGLLHDDHGTAAPATQTVSYVAPKAAAVAPKAAVVTPVAPKAAPAPVKVTTAAPAKKVATVAPKAAAVAPKAAPAAPATTAVVTDAVVVTG